MTYPRVGHFKNVAAFRDHLRRLGLDLPMDDRILSAADGSPLAAPLRVRDLTVGNRWCIHPMEGWDGTPDGRPSAHTIRRWTRFGQSGAKLIWGGEALAVCHAGRANANQLYFRPENMDPMRQLLRTLRQAHADRFGKSAADNLLVGLQLTHSGRYSKPDSKTQLKPRIVYHHPLLDRRVGINANDDRAILCDDEIKSLVETFVYVATRAHKLGFQFVDIKACHGYLGHEFLSAFDRPGPYGGDLRGRSRFLREIIAGIRAQCPQLMIGVRLSAFDSPSHQTNVGPAVPANEPPPGSNPQSSATAPTSMAGTAGPTLGTAGPPDLYPGFGCRRDVPLQIDLTEPVQFLEMLRDECKVDLVNLTAGSPYYNPHIQRPAFFPPSDGYAPPEDPLIGCVRQMQVVRELKQRVPGLPMVGTAYTYFQEFLPLVAQALVREGWVDSVGLGRMVLAYPDLPADCLEHGELRQPKLLCRTFSDCTTGPRNGMISGCFPLDPYYKKLPEAAKVKQVKRELKDAR